MKYLLWAAPYSWCGPANTTSMCARSWLTTERRDYKPLNGRRQHHRMKGHSSSPRLDLFKLLQICTLLYSHEFEEKRKKKSHPRKNPPQHPHFGITVIPFLVIYLFPLSNSCSSCKNGLAAHETTTEPSHFTLEHIRLNSTNLNSLICSLHILAVVQCHLREQFKTFLQQVEN